MLWKDFEQRLPVAALAGLLMTASTILYAVNMGIIKAVSVEVHPFIIAFWRNFFALMFLMPMLIRKNRRMFHSRRWDLQIMRGFIQVFAMLTWFTAISMMPLADVTSIMFTAPIMVGMGAVILFGEQMGLRRWSAAAIGFLGVLIILRPGFGEGGWESLVAIGAAIGWSGLTLSMKSLTRYDSTVTIVAVNMLLATPMALIFALFVWEWPSPENLALVALQGGLGVIGQLSMTRAMGLADASYVINFDFLRLPFAALIGILVFAEPLDPFTVLGSLVIISSTAYFLHRERLAQQSADASSQKRDHD